MQHAEYLRDLPDDQVVDSPPGGSDVQNGAPVSTTLPTFVWVAQNGKKYHTTTACPSLKYSQPTSKRSLLVLQQDAGTWGKQRLDSA